MRALGTLIIAALACAGTAANASVASDFFPICAKPPASAARTLTVDPSGRGAYPNIPAALKAAKPGDFVDLMTGDYGDVRIDGRNSGFVTIEAAPGQTPQFTKLLIGEGGGASHWRLKGLSVSGFSTGMWGNGIAHPGLVFMTNSDNIIFEENNIYSQNGQMSWKSEADMAAAKMTVSGGIGVDQSSCISIVKNHLSNLFNGIMVGGDQTGDRGKYFVVDGNTIDNIAGDGIDHSASHIRILHNQITNSHDICENKCIHTDGIQGWNWHNKPGLLNTDVVIDSNEIILQTKPGLVLTAGDFHGITIFDGIWDGMQISNNLIVTGTWHGISTNRVNNLSIVNNTVVGTNPARGTWIAYNPNKNDPPDTVYHIVIRNNVAPAIANDKRGATQAGLAVDHNLVLKSASDFADNFVKFDPEHFAYDLHPTKRSDARGEGSAEGAPAVDIDGRPRQGKIDVGAYAYQGN
ncbi:MAG: right-handed parallel beta-helix repeat-containing protein [Alphaproteobacteria bacterium]|nr:right-handed parallel beta-helix repeat-containing protein [Alphaproteobacteria bacterium]